jgi:hypothetical protein
MTFVAMSLLPSALRGLIEAATILKLNFSLPEAAHESPNRSPPAWETPPSPLNDRVRHRREWGKEVGGGFERYRDVTPINRRRLYNSRRGRLREG